MLDGAQEPVGGDQGRGVVPPDVAAGRQRHERGQRAAHPQRRIDAAVHHLEQLDGELDVAQAAAAELELPLGLRGRDVGLDPAAHGLHLADEARPVAGRPDERPERVDVGPAEVGIAGDGAHLQQRLELPGARPLPVVGLVAGDGAHERPGLALRSQCGVDLPGGLVADPHQRGGDPRRAAQGRALGVRRVDRFGDEHDVDVADVVEFTPAGLAQGDDRQPAGRGGGGLLGDGEGQTGGEDGRGDVGQLGGDLLCGEPVTQIAPGDGEDRPPVGHPECGDPLRRRVGGALAQLHAPGRVVGVGSDGGEHVALQLLGRRPVRAAGEAFGVVVQDRPVGRVRREVVGQAGARAEHRQQPAAQQPRPAQPGEQRRGGRPRRVGGVEGLDEAVQRADGEVGVAGPRERRDHRPGLGVGGLVALEVPQPQRGVGQQPGRARAVLEPEADQPDHRPARDLLVDRRHGGPPLRRPGGRAPGPGRRTGRRTAPRPLRCRGCAASERRQMVSRSCGLAATPTTSRSAHSWTISGAVSMWNCSP